MTGEAMRRPEQVSSLVRRLDPARPGLIGRVGGGSGVKYMTYGDRMSEKEMEKPGSESLVTVIVAGLANLAIGVAKLVAGLVSGSSAMLSEAVHSAADTVTEVLLFVAVRRGGSRRRPAPFGHGKAGFFWALMAAFADPHRRRRILHHPRRAQIITGRSSPI